MLIHTILLAYGRQTITSSWQVDADIGVNRFYYIHSGDVSFYQNGKAVPLKPEFLYLLPQNQKFEPIFSLPSEIDHSYFDFITVPKINLPDFLEINPQEHPILKKALAFGLSVTDKYQYAGSAKPHFSLAKTALDAMLTSLSMTISLTPSYDERLHAVLSYISEHYQEDISLDRLCGLCFLSKRYFIRLFRQSVGTTPYQYIKSLRLTHAVSLLRLGVGVSEIAFLVGYESVSAFSKAIRKEYGKSPAEISRAFFPDSVVSTKSGTTFIHQTSKTP